MHRQAAVWTCALIAVVLQACPARADLGAFIATVGFDDEANLNRGMGIGARWGASRGLVGGETSLMLVRPEREVGADQQSTTALFYEGRLLLNLPVTDWRPFVGIGLGAVTVTSTESRAPTGAEEAVVAALDAIADLQTNTALSYGGGIRYAVRDRIHLRGDVRQYIVLSVKGIAAAALEQHLEEQTGVAAPDRLVERNTAHYNEMSIGISVSF